MVSERIQRRIPQAQLVVIDRTAHMLLVERPQACADAIASFLREAVGVSG